MSELRGLVIGNSTWPSKLIGLRLGNIRESTNSQPQKETFENTMEKSKKKSWRSNQLIGLRRRRGNIKESNSLSTFLP